MGGWRGAWRGDGKRVMSLREIVSVLEKGLD